MPTQGNVHFTNFRKCEFGQLTTYRSSGEELLHGTQEAYEQVTKYILENPSMLDTASENRPLFEIMPSQFNVLPSLQGFATYSAIAVSDSFPSLKPGLLPSLINAHLHEHFLREHPVFAIIDPIEDSRLNMLRRQITSVANSIATCPSSPIAGSCPPGFPRCKSCKPGSVVQFRSLANVPHDAYVFGSVPHPYTFLLYTQQKESLDARFVRDTQRDSWVSSVTAEIMDKRTGGFQRLQMLKDLVKSDSTMGFNAKTPVGMWETWEEFDLSGLDSILGFHVDFDDRGGKEDASHANDLNPVTFIAKDRVLSLNSETRDMVESWNLAWTELWYFIRALQQDRRSK
jgi:hypothetical protein